MSTLLVELSVTVDHSAPNMGREFRYALTTDGETLISHGQAAASMLPAADQIVAVVPPQALSWHQVDLPKIAPAKRQAALCGLLEERLLTDPTQTHLAWMDGVKPGAAVSGAWIAICDKAWLSEQLNLLEQSGKAVGTIAPLLSPRPVGSVAQSMLMEHDGLAWLGTATESGVWSYPLSQHKTLGLTCAEHLQSEPSVAAQAEAALNPDGATNLRMSVSPSGTMLLNALSTRCNLAQGEFARNTRDRLAQRAVKWTQEFLHARPWRWARWSAVGVVAVHLLGLNTWAWLEHRELGGLKQHMQDLLTQTFPQVKVVVDAPIQMQKELQILEQRQGSATSTDLEALLSLVGQAGDAKAAASLEYAQGQLTLRDASLSPPQLERLRQTAQARQLTVRTQGNDLVVGAAP